MSNIFRRKTFKRPVKKSAPVPTPEVKTEPTAKKASPKKPVVRRKRKELVKD